MSRNVLRPFLFVVLGYLLAAFPVAGQNQIRRITADVGNTAGPGDRFFDLSVGSDFPGTLTRDTPATITLNPDSTSGLCRFTVTDNDDSSTQTDGGWIVVGNPAGALTVASSNNQAGKAGTVLAHPLNVTLDAGLPGIGKPGAGILFSASARAISNSTTSGSR